MVFMLNELSKEKTEDRSPGPKIISVIVRHFKLLEIIFGLLREYTNRICGSYHCNYRIYVLLLV
jgi:hypothetical protein